MADVKPAMATLALAMLAIPLRAAAAAAAPPPTAADPAVDSLLGQATTAPASQPSDSLPPATQPAFATPATLAPGRPGTLLLSDGTTLTGRIATTPGKPIRLWDEDQKQYQDLPLPQIATIEGEVVWERTEQEWSYDTNGSDVKTLTGRTYPARMTDYRITLTNGDVFDGGVVAPLIITTATGVQTYILHKRDKGTPGQTEAQLVYVKRVTFQK